MGIHDSGYKQLFSFPIMEYGTIVRRRGCAAMADERGRIWLSI
jgi:hypothetical protein